MTEAWQTAYDIAKAYFTILYDPLQMLFVLSAFTTKVHYFNLFLLIESINVFHFEM